MSMHVKIGVWWLSKKPVIREIIWVIHTSTKSMFEEWLATQEPERVVKDIRTSTKWMLDEFLAAGGRVLEVLSRDHDDFFFSTSTRMDKSLAVGVKVTDTLCKFVQIVIMTPRRWFYTFRGSRTQLFAQATILRIMLLRQVY